MGWRLGLRALERIIDIMPGPVDFSAIAINRRPKEQTAFAHQRRIRCPAVNIGPVGIATVYILRIGDHRRDRAFQPV